MVSRTLVERCGRASPSSLGCKRKLYTHRQSLELLAAAHATPQEELDRWWFRAQLPTSMGGEGVGGHDEQCDAAYSAGVIACWPRLRETSSGFAEVPLLANIPMLRDFTQSFLRLVQLRDDIDATYTEFAKHPHHFITGDKFKGYFRPQKLPTTLRTIRELFDRENPSPPTAQRTFSQVKHHERWLQGRTAALAADEQRGDNKYPTAVTYISASQYGAGAWLDIAPDGTFGTKIESPKFEVMLERRGRLDIAMAKGANDALLAAGEETDYKGDNMSNKGEFNRRHNATNRATYDYVRAAATGPVILPRRQREAPPHSRAEQRPCA